MKFQLALGCTLHASVLDYLASIKVPDGRKEVEVNWGEDSPLSIVGSKLADDHDFCPCEFLTYDARFDLEVQHKDGLFGRKHGPVGNAFANALTHQADGYNNMQALLAPNLPPPVRAMLITKVETNNIIRIGQMWGTVQEKVAKAIADAWENGWFPKGYNKSHLLLVAPFIHPFAGLVPPADKDGKFDKKKFLEGEAKSNSLHAIGALAYLSTLGLLSDALTGGLSPEEILVRKQKSVHPYRGYKEVGAVEAAT